MLGREFLTDELTISTADVKSDFTIAQGDRIDLSRIAAYAGGPDNVFTFIVNALSKAWAIS